MLRLFDWHIPLAAGGVDDQPERRLNDAITIAILIDKLRQQRRNRT